MIFRFGTFMILIGKAVSILLFGKEIINCLLCPYRGYTSVHML